MVFSTDTDVLVLVIAHYDLLLKKTSMSMSSGVVQVQPIHYVFLPPREVTAAMIENLRHPSGPPKRDRSVLAES